MDKALSDTIRFLPLQEEHVPLLRQWLKEPHVTEFWQEPEEEEEFRRKFLALPDRGVCPFIIALGSKFIGYIQYYEARKVGGGWWPEAKDGTFGIDQFIGDPTMINKGYGTSVIRKFVEQLFQNPGINEVITDPDPKNHRAIRAYEKVGFLRVGEIKTPGGDALLLRLGRPIFQRLIVPSDRNLTLNTARVLLEPIQSRHAGEMIGLLSDEALYSYIPANPPTLDSLRTTYSKWESRISPEGDELWLNWVARRKSDALPIGHFQAGVKSSKESYIAYTVGTAFQRQGYAFESLRAICAFLQEKLTGSPIKAWIDTRNAPSIELVKKLGMRQVDFIRNADHFKGSQSDEFVFQLVACDE